MSLTQITYDQRQKSLQIILRIFIEDLQTEMNSLANESFELATDREPKNIESKYQDYLKENLSFRINSTHKTYEYIGKEYDNDMVVFYLEIPKIDTLKTLTTYNKILNHSFPKQENIIKTKVYNKHKSIILTPYKTKSLINF